MSAVSQAVTVVIGLLGSLAGLAALAGVLTGRRKLKAEAADMLTDAALTLVEPLKMRVTELEAEVRLLREEMSSAHGQVRRWSAAILSPAATLEDLRAMVMAEIGRGNGRPP